MEDQLNITSFQDSIAKAKNILVLLPANPTLDKAAAALSLFLSLKKQNKQVLVACSTPMTVGFNRLFSIDKITDKIGNRNLIISFDYLKDAIEKVSYNIENDKFNLVVEPRPGAQPLKTDKVNYSYAGTEADLIIVIGASRLEDLDSLYINEKKTFEKAQIVNLDYKRTNMRFGQLNLLDNKAASCSEIVADLLKRVNLPVDQDIATNILAGIEANTSNYQSPETSAKTFAAAAWCLENGAKKGYINFNRPTFPTPAFLNPTPQATQSFPSIVNNVPSVPAPSPVTYSSPAMPFQTPVQTNTQTQPPPDWFKPKIFKSNSVI